VQTISRAALDVSAAFVPGVSITFPKVHVSTPISVGAGALNAVIGHQHASTIPTNHHRMTSSLVLEDNAARP